MDMFSPVLQLGFAAFSVFQLIIIFFLIKEITKLFEKIVSYTVVLQKLVDTIESAQIVQKEILEKLRQIQAEIK